ncbi:MAG: DNA polymerase III subunit epsilon [Methylotenera sp.]|jgi:DNA polymerase-3 subunit epsilon|uniref:DNA polymerase III subunit epsilon n=1 Tax=Methylotenera sp. TaxID=2051956 RepID=UPI000D49479F|nr:DNA polymerase III subunit epsilon [Methylotenera sp.]MDP3210431.1 DNA polymerase III subunit epsilon [Methylotenera sp.]MDP3776773.1 DNA polymerase III subunit epsilon [Methylotenera sp.]PPC97192.1 MAG: DNA polymerase III subunit epsilon [Methylotenera sp.]
MRQIFLDTETTGLYHAQGHRVIEIAAVEVVNRRLTKHHFHYYLNPDREIDQGAQEVHGISLEFLQDKPRFADIANELITFIADAELIMHNAPFDVGFLNCELGLIGQKKVESITAKITDTLKIAKEMRPGQRNNLDALCKHFGIDNSRRTLHGALLDAELLADVYMAMTRGQESLMIGLDQPSQSVAEMSAISHAPLIIKHATTDELADHEAYLAGLAKSGNCVWNS